MTAQDILTEVFERVGEPSDLCPFNTPGDSATFDTTMALGGIVKLLRWVNNAQVRIANWKFSDGRPVRCRTLLDRMYFQNKAAITGTASSATSTTLTWPALNPLNAADQFNGWIIETTGGTGSGQIRIIIDSSGLLTADCVVTVHKAWDTTPDATTTFKLYKRFFKFVTNPVAGSYTDYHIAIDARQTLNDILKVTDIEGQSDLATINRSDVLTGTMIGNSPASSYARFGDTLYFDTAYDSLRSYEMLYYRQPVALSLYNDVPELPSPFHEAIVLWAAHSIQMREQDFTGAYATKRDLQELMQTLRLQGDLEGSLEENGVSVYGE